MNLCIFLAMRLFLGGLLLFWFYLWENCHVALNRHSFPDCKYLNSPSHKLSSVPNKWHHSVFMFASFVSLFSFLPNPVATQLSTITVVHGHNVVSVFLKQMSLKTICMIHTTYTLSSPWKYPSLSLRQYYTVKSYCIWDQGEFQQEMKPKRNLCS